MYHSTPLAEQPEMLLCFSDVIFSGYQPCQLEKDIKLSFEALCLSHHGMTEQCHPLIKYFHPKRIHFTRPVDRKVIKRIKTPKLQPLYNFGLHWLICQEVQWQREKKNDKKS